MSQLVGNWVAGDSGRQLHYYVTLGGSVVDVTLATSIVLSLVRRSGGSDVSVVIPGEVLSGAAGSFKWAGANAIGLYVPAPVSRLAPDVYEARVSFTLSGATYWTDPFRVAVDRWGLSTVPTSMPGLDASIGLQEAVDALSADGGTIVLGGGVYYADPTSPSTELNVTKPVRFLGAGRSATDIASPVLVGSGGVGFEYLYVRPSGAAYGVKIYDGVNFLSRCWFKQVFIGGTDYNSNDGPTIGLHLDGAGVLHADQLTVAFCGSHGLLADSTGAEPNTTLICTGCTFNLNRGYGVRILTSMTLAEFRGGNMECNDSGEFIADGVTLIHLLGVDFERGTLADHTVPAISNLVELQNNFAPVIDRCNFVSNNSKSTRAILASGCASGHLGTNRYEGYGAVGVVRIGETCTNWTRGAQRIHSGGGWIEDYSRTT